MDTARDTNKKKEAGSEVALRLREFECHVRSIGCGLLAQPTSVKHLTAVERPALMIFGLQTALHDEHIPPLIAKGITSIPFLLDCDRGVAKQRQSGWLYLLSSFPCTRVRWRALGTCASFVLGQVKP
jgi:hypothetical protein